METYERRTSLANLRCGYCLFETLDKVREGGIRCDCSRCLSVRANGFCNTNHANAYEDMKAEKRRA